MSTIIENANTNQQNAQNSTGPITVAGKAASSKNSFRHGLTAAATTMAYGESHQDFIDMGNDFLAEHKPVTITEEALVYKMVQSIWLSKRASRLQQQLFLNSAEPDPTKLALYMRYQAMHDQTFHKAHNELRKMRQDAAKVENGFVSQAQKQEVHVAKICHQNTRMQAVHVAIEYGKLRNARLLAACAVSVAASSVTEPMPMAA